MDQPAFTSLIVTYNSASEILNLLADLVCHAPDNRIIVIDNASKDETVRLVQKHYPHVHLVQNTANLGYARAVNQGFDLCDTSDVLLLNPDIRIPSPQVLAALSECLCHARHAAVAAPLQFKDESERPHLNFTWSYSTWGAFRVYLSFLLGRKQSLSEPIRVTFLNAGCLFIRREMFARVGQLNERYFLYGEEPDLFLKFRRFGFECYLLPNVAVTHYRERSLMTRPLWQQLTIRLHAIRNIVDALLRGWSRILLDKLVGRKTYKKRISGNLG